MRVCIYHVLAGISVIAMALSNAVGADDVGADALARALRAWSGMVHSIKADVTTSESPGRELRAFADARRTFDEWALRNGRASKDSAAKRAAQIDKLAAGFPVAGTAYHYRAVAPRMLRWEEVGESLRKPLEPIIYVFAEDRWKDLVPPSRLTDRKQHEMTVHSDNRASVPPVDMGFARAAFVPVGFASVFKKELPQYVSAVGQIYWDDLLTIAASRGSLQASISSAPPTAKSLPTLDLVLPMPGKPENRYVFRVWLDPQSSYCPVALDVFGINPENGGEMFPIRYRLVEWSDARRLRDGVVLPTRCIDRVYSQFAVPRDEQTLGPQRSYECRVHEMQLSDVVVNGPLDSALFDLQAPAGANVVDEIGRERYLAGSAGEALDRMALEERVMTREKPSPQHGRSAILWWFVAGAAVACVALLSWKLRRRRQI